MDVWQNGIGAGSIDETADDLAQPEGDQGGGASPGDTRLALRRVVTATGQPDARIVVTVADSGQGGRSSGVVMRSDASAATYLSAYSQNGSGGRIYLAKRQGNTTTTTWRYRLRYLHELR